MDFNFRKALETLYEFQYIEETAQKVLELTINELKKNHVLLKDISNFSFYVR